MQTSDFIVQVPNQASALVLLAHGAGAPMDSPFMSTLADSLFSRGVAVARFEFPYMQERRHAGKKRPPNKIDVLIQSYSEAVEWARATYKLPLFVAGKSMGGRVASMLYTSQGEALNGCICYGYPFHPPKNTAKLRIEHLLSVISPLLIIHGTRDPFGKPEEVRSYGLPQHIEVAWLETGDHDFAPLKKTGKDQNDLIESAAALTQQYVQQRLFQRVSTAALVSS